MPSFTFTWHVPSVLTDFLSIYSDWTTLQHSSSHCCWNSYQKFLLFLSCCFLIRGNIKSPTLIPGKALWCLYKSLFCWCYSFLLILFKFLNIPLINMVVEDTVALKIKGFIIVTWFLFRQTVSYICWENLILVIQKKKRRTACWIIITLAIRKENVFNNFWSMTWIFIQDFD